MKKLSALSVRVGLLAAVIMVAAVLAPRPGMAWLAVPVAVGGAAWLAVIATRLATRATRQGRRADRLRQLSRRLGTDIKTRSADARDSHARLRSVIDSAVDGIIVIDDRGAIESFNPGAERLFGYSEAEVLGRNINVLMPSPYREEHDAYLSRYIQTGHAKIIGTGREVSGLRKDGSNFPLHLSVGEFRVGTDRRFTGIVHDLTNRVGMEDQLRERAALAKLGEMAAVIAHEVKNPLAGVRGAIQIIGGRLPSSSQDTRIVNEIVNRIDGLDRLINDLLLFAREPQPRLAAVDLAPLVAMTADLIAADPLLHGVRIEVTGECRPVQADAGMLKIVLQNLLVNAAHAMNGTGTIRVAIDSSAGRCRVRVADDGPGITPEHLARVFTPFFTTRARGSGLGLATARRLIEAHHGEIGVQCPPGQGTTVTFELPFPQPQ